MRMAFDNDRFKESLSEATVSPVTSANQKQSMAPTLVPLCNGILDYAAQTPVPKTTLEMREQLTSLLCTALAIGFDAGRIYEEKEQLNVSRIIQ